MLSLKIIIEKNVFVIKNAYIATESINQLSKSCIHPLSYIRII